MIVPFTVQVATLCSVLFGGYSFYWTVDNFVFRFIGCFNIFVASPRIQAQI